MIEYSKSKKHSFFEINQYHSPGTDYFSKHGCIRIREEIFYKFSPEFVESFINERKREKAWRILKNG